MSLSLPAANVTPGRLDLTGNDALAPGADYKQDINLDTDETTAFDLTGCTSAWQVYVKRERDDADADAVLSGSATVEDEATGELYIYFNGSDVTPDMIGMYWWVLRGGNETVTQTFLWGKAEIKYL